MAETKTFVANAPVWVDLSSTDAAKARDFYSKLFGWKAEVTKDPEAGGYALATIGNKNVAGLGPKQPGDGSPSAWSLYIGTRDIDVLAKKVQAEGGTVIAPPFDVLKSGRMAVFQDPSGAFISAWQPNEMQGADIMQVPNTFAWAELNSRGLGKAEPFYKKVFGWGEKKSPLGEGLGDYTEFKLNNESILGALEMMPMVPKEVPSYWLVYFAIDDVDKAHKKAVDLGGREMLPPQDYPGGRYSIVADPQGAAFGLMKIQR